MNPARRALWGRVGAAVAHSRHDSRDLTRTARRRFLERFERQARERWPDLDDAAIERIALELRRSYMGDLSQRAAASRKTKSRRAEVNSTAATEDRDDGADPPP
jgi:hypothetical protein